MSIPRKTRELLVTGQKLIKRRDFAFHARKKLGISSGNGPPQEMTCTIVDLI